ncbi:MULTISPECIES: spermidine synthase [Paenibacillus]|uniref:spermidine synthase n=1 Tax=Paenibacillus TaxID=44249 RepID=UPI0022B86AC5|nr:fused MFS/spermidine synthase [Paenibacillus caseinilyticus]MCZ8520940.1 fused MFS/spermidine synthase [Paenibacillus caseinilyticus]
MQLLFKESSSYNQEIAVYEASLLYGKPGRYRFLQFSDGAVQGAVDLENPQRIVLEYPRGIIHLMEHNDASFSDVSVIGHGIGTIPGRYPDKRFVVAEIDAKVVECSRTFFGCHLPVTIGDGRSILQQQQGAAFDYVILDAFDREGTPGHFTTAEFFGLAKEKLRPGGALLLNLMGKPGNDPYLNAVCTTLRQAFPYLQAFYLPGEEQGHLRNVIVMGGSSPLGFQGRRMAGFVEFLPGQGYILRDKSKG